MIKILNGASCVIIFVGRQTHFHSLASSPFFLIHHFISDPSAFVQTVKKVSTPSSTLVTTRPLFNPPSPPFPHHPSLFSVTHPSIQTPASPLKLTHSSPHLHPVSSPSTFNPSAAALTSANNSNALENPNQDWRSAGKTSTTHFDIIGVWFIISASIHSPVRKSLQMVGQLHCLPLLLHELNSENNSRVDNSAWKWFSLRFHAG